MLMIPAAFTQQHLQDENKFVHKLLNIGQSAAIHKTCSLKLRYFIYPVILMAKGIAYKASMPSSLVNHTHGRTFNTQSNLLTIIVLSCAPIFVDSEMWWLQNALNKSLYWQQIDWLYRSHLG